MVHDYVTWRDDLRTVTDIGAFRTVTRNVVASDGTPEPIAVADLMPCRPGGCSASLGGGGAGR